LVLYFWKSETKKKTRFPPPSSLLVFSFFFFGALKNTNIFLSKNQTVPPTFKTKGLVFLACGWLMVVVSFMGEVWVGFLLLNTFYSWVEATFVTLSFVLAPRGCGSLTPIFLPPGGGFDVPTQLPYRCFQQRGVWVVVGTFLLQKFEFPITFFLWVSLQLCSLCW